MLYVFIEGNDDERFITWYFDKLCIEIKPIKYAGKTSQYVNKFINSINAMPDSDYVFLVDSDTKPLEERKKDTISKYNMCSIEKVYVVETEIESWYLAGLDDCSSRKLNIKSINNTDNITKEKFYSLFKNFCKVSTLLLILKFYDISVAKSKNTTFNIFDESRMKK